MSQARRMQTKTKNQATIGHFQSKHCIVQHMNQQKMNENDEKVGFTHTAIQDNELSNGMR